MAPFPTSIATNGSDFVAFIAFATFVGGWAIGMFGVGYTMLGHSLGERRWLILGARRSLLSMFLLVTATICLAFIGSIACALSCGVMAIGLGSCYLWYVFVTRSANDNGLEDQ